ncbi:MAG: hypothetical protein ACLUIO_21315 [Neglectibacter timonensis]
MEQKNQEKHKHFHRLQVNIAQESLLLKYNFSFCLTLCEKPDEPKPRQVPLLDRFLRDNSLHRRHPGCEDKVHSFLWISQVIPDRPGPPVFFQQEGFSSKHTSRYLDAPKIKRTFF